MLCKYIGRVIISSSLYILPIAVCTEETKPAHIDEYDATAIELVMASFHFYCQVTRGEKLDLQQETSLPHSRFVPFDFFHLAKGSDFLAGWEFYPFNGKTGSLDWGRTRLMDESMVGFVAINRQKKLLALVFRGSQRPYDWFNNINLGLKKAPYLSYSGWLHAGYVNAFAGYLKEMDATFTHCIEGIEDLDDYTLIVTGHSLGGAVATLAAAYISEKETYQRYFSNQDIRLISFGAPIVGMRDETHDFNHWMQKNGIQAKCFVRLTDFSPHVTQIAKFTYPVGYWFPRFVFTQPVSVGTYIVLPSYGAKPYQWQKAHSVEGYLKGIYEHLDRPYKPLTQLYILGMAF